MSLKKEAYWFGRRLMHEAVVSAKNKGNVKIAAVRENFEQIRKAEETIAQIKIASRYTALDEAVELLRQAGFNKAAGLLHKAAMEEAQAVAEAVNGDNVSEEELINVAVEAAAEELAEQTGRNPEDPEVIEAAVEEVANGLQEIVENGEA
jgi:biotin synthase-related radical SAM superfamily protein